MKNKKVLLLKKIFFGRTAKVHPKDGVSRLNFPEGFGWDHIEISSDIKPPSLPDSTFNLYSVYLCLLFPGKKSKRLEGNRKNAEKLKASYLQKLIHTFCFKHVSKHASIE